MVIDDRGSPAGSRAVTSEIVRAVYDRYGRAVHTIAVSILHDQAAAADVVQATFLNAWRAASRFTPDRELGPWLYAIASRQAIDAYRRERRVEVSDADSIDVVELPPSLERTWEAWEVRLALDKLPARRAGGRPAGLVRGLSHPEVAERLGIPVGTVSRGCTAPTAGSPSCSPTSPPRTVPGRPT